MVIDFDYHQPVGTAPGEPGHEDPFAAISRALAGAPDLFWTPRNGGHWVATRGQDIRAILSDPSRFSSRSVFIPDHPHKRILPMEADPPEHAAYRRILAPAFEQEAIEPLLREAREAAISRIEEIRKRGSSEFMADFANWLPATVVFGMCDLPVADREAMIGWISSALRPIDGVRAGKPAGEPGKLFEYVDGLVRQGRERGCPHGRPDSPPNNLKNKIFSGSSPGGGPLSDDELFGMLNGVLGGGFDTTAACMGWAALFLARNPGHRARLSAQLDDPALLACAAEELIRRFSVSNIARVVVRDMDYRGVTLKQGEQILLQSCLYSLDEKIFPSPLDVDFRRPGAGLNVTFSYGAHRCPARNLALREMTLFLEEWLKRIPDFEIDPDSKVRTATGVVHSVAHLPLRWKA